MNNMKIILLISCVVAVSYAIPLNDSPKEVIASTFESEGPQPVDVIAITNDGIDESSKRVARRAFGGVNIAVGVPIASYGYGGYGGGYGGYPYGGYGGGYGGYGGGYGGYGGGYGGYRGYGGGYGGGWGYGGGYGHHHHHHHRW